MTQIQIIEEALDNLDLLRELWEYRILQEDCPDPGITAKEYLTLRRSCDMLDWLRGSLSEKKKKAPAPQAGTEA